VARFSSLLLILAVLAPAAWGARHPILFAYFKDQGKSGVYFALCDDCYQFQPLNHGDPWLPPSLPGELMRDPFLTRGPNGEFHMVWTWDWRVKKIGYAHSRDLIHWSEQREIALMAEVAGAENAWAPEIYWVTAKKKWLIVWSSTAEGRDGHRIYSSLTADFRDFSKPAVFFDPGYSVIDATLLHTRGRYYLIFKDEREQPLHKEIKIAEGPTIEGPWSKVSAPITGPWCEGPSALELGARYVIYYDHYREPQRYEAVESTDLEHWSPIIDKAGFPPGARHGSFLPVTPEEARRLRARK
jgi:hypothetical protein